MLYKIIYCIHVVCIYFYLFVWFRFLNSFKLALGLNLEVNQKKGKALEISKPFRAKTLQLAQPAPHFLFPLFPDDPLPLTLSFSWVLQPLFFVCRPMPSFPPPARVDHYCPIPLPALLSSFRFT
jgi:hypothetical protein